MSVVVRRNLGCHDDLVCWLLCAKNSLQWFGTKRPKIISSYNTGVVHLIIQGGGKGDTRRLRESKAVLEAAALEMAHEDRDHRSSSTHRSYSHDREREHNGTVSSSSRRHSRSRDRDRDRDRDHDRDSRRSVLSI